MFRYVVTMRLELPAPKHVLNNTQRAKEIHFETVVAANPLAHENTNKLELVIRYLRNVENTAARCTPYFQRNTFFKPNHFEIGVLS